MLQFILPDLIVPDNEDEVHEWSRKIMNFCSFATSYNYFSKDIRRYQYRYGNINPAEFTHVTQMYSMNESDSSVVLPSFIRQINPIDAMVKRQVGSLLTQPFNFTTYVNDELSIENKLEEVKELAKQKLSKALRQMSGIEKEIGGPLVEGDDIPIDLSELASLNFDNHKTEWEKIYQSLAEMFVKLPDIEFKQKYYHNAAESLLISNKMIFKRYYDNQLECPSFRPIDPRTFFCIPALNGTHLIENFVLCCDVQWLTLEEIMASDPSLNDEEVQKLMEVRSMYYSGLLGGWYNTNQSSLGGSPNNGGYDGWFNNYYQGDVLTRTFRIKVVNAEWKANKKLRYNVIPDGLDGTMMKKIDAKKKIKTEKGEKEDVRWEEESFSGVVYGHFMLGTIVRNITVSEHKDAPSKVKLNYCGIVDPTPSFVDNLIELQNLRIQLFYKLELLANQISGKVLVIDKAAGGDLAKNLYNLGAFRMMEINTGAEGSDINPNAGQNIRAIDMELSQSFQQLLMVLNYIDNQMAFMTGQNDAASGNMKDYASNGLAQQQLQQSQLVNIPMIENFFTVGSRLLQGLCDMIPQYWQGKKIMKYYLSDDNQKRLIDLEMPKNMEDFPNIAVHVIYSSSDSVLKNQIVASANQLLATTQSPDIINSIFKMNLAPTAKTAQMLFEQAVTKVNADKAKEQEMQQQAMAQQQQAMQQAKIAPAQIQAQAHVQGKQISANAEIQKQLAKNEHEGMKVDAEKANAMDEMVAQAHLDNGMPKQQ